MMMKNGKPKFMEHLQVSVPKFEDMGESKIGMTINTLIHSVEDIDDAIGEEIIKMIKEKGINDLYLLNKRAIVSALEKQIPKMPTSKLDFAGLIQEEPCECKYHYCPCCKEELITTINNRCVEERKYSHCHYCGQALDWSDTE